MFRQNPGFNGRVGGEAHALDMGHAMALCASEQTGEACVTILSP